MEKETKHTETDRVERFIEVINWSGVNKSEFGRQIGVLSPRSITAIATDRKNPSSKMIQKVVDRWPQINYDWLLTGHGEMLSKEVPLKPISSSVAEQAHDYLDLRSVGKKLEEQDYSLNKVADKMYEVLKVVKDLREEVDEKLNFTVKFAKQSLDALVSNQEVFVSDFERSFKKAVEGTQDEFFKSLFKQREKLIEIIDTKLNTNMEYFFKQYQKERDAAEESRQKDIKYHLETVNETKKYAEVLGQKMEGVLTTLMQRSKIAIDGQEKKLDSMVEKLEQTTKSVEEERRHITSFIQDTFEPFVQKQLLSRQELTNIVETKATSVVKEELKKLRS